MSGSSCNYRKSLAIYKFPASDASSITLAAAVGVAMTDIITIEISSFNFPAAVLANGTNSTPNTAKQSYMSHTEALLNENEQQFVNKVKFPLKTYLCCNYAGRQKDNETK